MQVVIWILGFLVVIGAGIGLGLLIYYLYWQKEGSDLHKEFEEFKAAIEAKIQEALSKGSELNALRSAIESLETKLQDGLVKPSELDKLKTVLQANEKKLQEEYVTSSQFNRFKDAIKEIM